MKAIIKFKIKSLGITDAQFNALPFGRQIEYTRKVTDWKAGANVGYVSQKRKAWRTAIAEFVKLNDVKEYWCHFHSSDDYFDDTFEFFWK